MIRDITIGQYFPGKSAIHKMDPRIKILLSILYIVMLFVADNMWGLLLGVLFGFAAYLISRIPLSMIWKSMKPVVPIVIFTAVLNLFLSTGDPLWQWKFLKITREGIETAVFMSVRILCLIAGTSLLTYTTSPIALTDGIERLLLSRLTQQEVKDWIRNYAAPYKELMAYYRCAMMEVETKFSVLNEELSLQYDRNPIESIKTRLKSPQSIVDKLVRRGLPLSVESIEKNLNDIAGVRVICSFPSDIYMLSEAFLRQDDIILLQKKDYIQSPKDNGYRSLHLIVETPIFLHNQKRMMKVEVQFRTISMDWWASLEHKIRYKKDIPDEEEIERELFECAEASAALDLRMQAIQKRVEESENAAPGIFDQIP